MQLNKIVRYVENSEAIELPPNKSATAANDIKDNIITFIIGI